MLLYREYDEEQDLQVQQLELDNSEYEKELRSISAEGDALKTEHDKLRETRRQLKDFMVLLSCFNQFLIMWNSGIVEGTL